MRGAAFGMKLLKNGKVIIKKAEVADSYLKKLTGLMGRKKIAGDYALFIPCCRSIHTFFMKTEIDVVMTGKNNKVVFLKEKLPPWKITGCKKAVNTIELKPGSVKTKKIRKGDKVWLK